MRFIDKFQYFKKHSKERQSLQDMTQKLPSNEDLTKEILKLCHEETTKIKLEPEIKNSYYVYLNDTIYLCDKKKNQEEYTRLLLIAHECRHAMQSKLLQLLNFALSNIEMIGFVICVILRMFHFTNIGLVIGYAIIVTLSILVRTILETDAVVQSIVIANKYIKEKLGDKEACILTEVFSFQVLFLFPIMLVSLFFGKIIRLGIILLLHFVI